MREEFNLFDFLKKLFRRGDIVAEQPSGTVNRESAVTNADAGPSSQDTKLCKTCGKPIAYKPSWKRIPNYCADCTAKYKAAQEAKRGLVTITCRNCGKTETIPANVQHWPDLCQECRAKLPAQQITRKCKGCGKEFTFPSDLRHWPNYCRQCQAKHAKKKKASRRAARA